MDFYFLKTLQWFKKYNKELSILLSIIAIFWLFKINKNYTGSYLVGADRFIHQAEPIVANDHMEYLYIAQKFWLGKNDPALVQLSDRYAAFLDHYPLRGIGLGGLMLSVRSFDHNSIVWRTRYVFLIAALSFFGEAIFAAGCAVFGNSIWYFPIMIYFLYCSEYKVEDSCIFTTEAVSRALLPAIAGILFFLCGMERKKGYCRTWKIAFVFFAVFSLLLCHIKPQWQVGAYFAGALLVLSKKTRITGIGILGTNFLISLSLLFINFNSFHGNRELFPNSGFIAAWYARGDSIHALGCAENLFPETAKKILCTDRAKEFINHNIFEVVPAADAAHVGEILSKLNSRVMLRDFGKTWEFFSRQAGAMFRYIFIPVPNEIGRYISYAPILFFLGVFHYFVLFYRREWELLLPLLAVYLFAIFPTAAGNLVIFWEPRYITPIRGLFFAIPIFSAALLLLRKQSRQPR